MTCLCHLCIIIIIFLGSIHNVICIILTFHVEQIYLFITTSISIDPQFQTICVSQILFNLLCKL